MLCVVQKQKEVADAMIVGTILLAEAHECEQRVMHDCRRLAICGPVGEDGHGLVAGEVGVVFVKKGP